MLKRITCLMVVALVVMGLIGCSSGQADETSKNDAVVSYDYKIVGEENNNFADVVRKSIRLVVKKQYSQDELKDIASQVIEQEKKSQDFNAVSILIYDKEEDAQGPYTVAMIEYAPEGNWSKADSVKTGNYSSHQFHYEFR